MHFVSYIVHLVCLVLNLQIDTMTERLIDIARRHHAFASSIFPTTNTILQKETTPSLARSQYYKTKPHRRQLEHNIARSNHAFASSITILQKETTPSLARSQYYWTTPRLRQLDHNIARSNHAFASSNTILHDQTTPSLARSQYYRRKPRLR
jgi:hypothetical protein